ncbi:MAG: zinc-ribbon domain-containing protein [candidate division WOR-3 bacterium]
MIKVRIETEESKIVEHPIDLPTLEKWIEDGILTADDEIWSDTLTGSTWKKIGDLTLFKRTTLEKQGAGSLAMEDLISRKEIVAMSTEQVKVRFCGNCGRKLLPEYKFCPKCGRSLENE